MTQRQRRALNSAIRTANLTVKSMASALGISQSTLRRYRIGSRRVPIAFLESVAGLLRYQAERLENKALMLDEIVRERAKAALRNR